MEFASVEEAVQEIRQGRIVIVLDDEDRENEGDFTLAAEKVTPETINFMAKYGRGLICLAMTGQRLDELRLPLMVDGNTNQFGTAFTVSIEARHGVTTGISAADRATTILTAINPASQHYDLVRPGHVFPLRARSGGVLERAGQTEASVDLARMAGLYPAGVICEIMNEDGSMARLPELEQVARTHGLKLVTVADIIAHRLKTETFVHKVDETPIATPFGDFTAVVFENSLDRENHLVLHKGNIHGDDPVLCRVQCQSTISDAFQALQGESAGQLRTSLEAINRAGCGILVYLRNEGTGGGLADELRFQASPESALVANPPSAPSSPDSRIYGIGAQILRLLGVRRIRLLTNHPRKIIGLQGYGITVVDQISLAECAGLYTRNKKSKLGVIK